MGKKFFWLIMSVLTVFTVATGVYLAFIVLAEPAARPSGAGFPAVIGSREGEPEVSARMVVREESEYLCGDVQIVYLGRAPRELVGLDRRGLEQKYPAQDGWVIEMGPDSLVLRRQCREFCPEHRFYRHLGISEGCLAVFEGPLGNNQKLVRVEKKIPLAALSLDWQSKLEQAMNFDRQPPEVQGRLRAELEFAGEAALNAGLENLDEQLKENANPGEKPENPSGLPYSDERLAGWLIA